MVTVRADLVLIGGNVLTMNSSRAFAQAIAVRNGRIVKVGSNEDIRQLVGKRTKVVCLSGSTVVPGFIDTHIHVVDFGKFSKWVALRDVKSIKEMQNRIKERVFVTPPGKWIMGHGWDQNCFAEKRLPSRYDLDACSDANPVLLYHQSGQMCLVNSRALEFAGVSKQTTVHQGGVVDRNKETGEPTGILRDSAMDLVWSFVPELNEDELVEVTGLACEEILKAGVTSMHWLALSAAEFSTVQRLLAQDLLPMRAYVIVPVNLLDSIKGFRSLRNSAKNNLIVGGVVIFCDGYLANRTAALFQSYSDCPGSRGGLLYTQEEMNKLARTVLKANLQLVIHAVGDRAVDAALNTFEAISRSALGKECRNRIEQAAVLNEGLLERIKEQGVVVSVQPRVIESEFSVWSAVEHLGSDRVRWLYPLKTLLSSGVVVSGGSDCPMEPLSPLIGIQAAVMRGFFPEERITPDEALRLYTVNAAYASFEENLKGSIEENKLADLTVLSRNPLRVSPDKIGGIEVEMTIVGGRIVFSKH